MNARKHFKDLVVAATVLVSLTACALAADEKPTVKADTKTKTITGEVSGMTKRSISIAYERDDERGVEYEMLLPFDQKEIKVEHRNSLSEIATGDTVKVSYVETVEENDQGQKKEDRKAKVITFIRARKDQTGALVSEEPLSLKGPK